MTIPVAKTQYGKASPKIKDNGILEFRGIPYGGGTGGERKAWDDMKVPLPWEGQAFVGSQQ